jgi:hypothetical protein
LGLMGKYLFYGVMGKNIIYYPHMYVNLKSAPSVLIFLIRVIRSKQKQRKSSLT